MCGICGGLQLDGADFAPDVLRGMAAALAHRGPDDDGFYFAGPAALAQRRLAIIDLAGGHQPLANEDQTVWVTYNGEIYNYPELAEELARRGHRFRTRSDTEVIVHAYEEWGLDCLARFNGMFALALWDAPRRRLVLARDPFGIKPLYLWQSPQRWLFASEIKAFRADPGFRPQVDPAALDEYLTYQFVPSPRTLLQGVAKLQPGHAVVWEAGQARTLAFHRPAPRPRPVPDERAAIDELRAALRAAVQRQMISDVPVGALLSGGVDSACVVALMRTLTGHTVKTFNVGFAGDFALNELAAARRTAALLGTEHHEVVLSAQDCLNLLDRVAWHLDEPVATPSALALYAVSQLAAQHVKVVLTGQGADEPWAGYRRYRGEKLGQWYRRVPARLRREVLGPLVNALPRAEALKRAAFALGLDDPAERFAGVYTVFTPAMKAGLYRAGGAAPAGGPNLEAIRSWLAPARQLPPLAQQLYVETRFSLPDNLLLYADKAAMAWSLEARVPLLDLELMEWVEGLPVELRLKGWAGHKYLYRQAIAAWVPAEVLRRPKIGFATPMDGWLQRELLGSVRERLLAPGSACDRYFSRAYIDRLIQDHAARRLDATRALYTLLAFESWHAQFLG